MLPPGFTGVIACLWRDQLPEKVYEVPGSIEDGSSIGTYSGATISASCIIKDEATRVTYMDTITTSVGWVAISGPKQ